VSPDGSAVYVTGSSAGSTAGGDAATVAYDAATGRTLWEQRYEDATVEALAVSSDASVLFVIGSSNGATGYLTIAYDTEGGTQLWEQHVVPAGVFDFATDVGVSPDGSVVFVTGTSYARDTIEDFATAALDAATGTTLWTNRYNGPGDDNDGPRALAVSPDGSAVYVMGPSRGSTGRVTDATVAYDASTGAEVWVRRVHAAKSGIIARSPLAVSPDGSTVFATGTDGRLGRLEEMRTVAYDARSGTRLWVRRYNGRADRPDLGGAVAVSPDGSTLFVAGASTGPTTRRDYATLA
jgi:outer membrane protein assembly factor BamB